MRTISKVNSDVRFKNFETPVFSKILMKNKKKMNVHPPPTPISKTPILSCLSEFPVDFTMIPRNFMFFLEPPLSLDIYLFSQFLQISGKPISKKVFYSYNFESGYKIQIKSYNYKETKFTQRDSTEYFKFVVFF